ncbi:MAG: ACT domain-containing protein, partial [Thermoplasmata archaeon]|nr:ACT domain-containing protein [Thermoplasmata archaeon]
EESLLADVKGTIPAKLLLGVERGLAVLAFRSRPEVAETPGVLAFMAEALFRSGINCLETVSVHTDSLFVFRDKDSIRAFQVLSTLVPVGSSSPSE